MNTTFGGGFLLPAPELEPSRETCHRPAPAAPESPRCRNRALRISSPARAGSAGLQRVMHASHAAKTRPCDEVDSAAQQFATAALRVVLEALDGRRNPQQLRPLAEPTVIAAVRTVAATGAPGRGLGAATLTRVDVMMSGAASAEVCAAYDRGARHFALAARIVRGRSGWRLTAFRAC
ncbi:Rv3235 family protein [Nocardia sp. NPDC088792]|uniref:Rv3235 family protein n=1 Tax=Nocardia sp. NPDC088792 TaxID=3364332 RepID=UPI003804D98D